MLFFKKKTKINFCLVDVLFSKEGEAEEKEEAEEEESDFDDEGDD